MKEKLLNFIDPFLSYIDSGKLFRKPFAWLYVVLAALNALLPFYFLYLAIDNGIFKSGAKSVFAFVFIWLFILAACWVGVQIWWNRKDKVQTSSQEGSEFPSTPVISHLIQTFGEWLGAFIAIVGFGVSLIASIFSVNLSSGLGLPLNLGWIGIVLFPIYGFLLIVITRFIAEQCRALVSIANNTKK